MNMFIKPQRYTLIYCMIIKYYTDYNIYIYVQ